MPKITMKMTHLYYQPEFINQANLLQESINFATVTEYADNYNNKFLKTLPTHLPCLLIDNKGLWLAYHQDGRAIKIQPNWLAQQKRVVNAGKKNELLLKACKIQPKMTVIDATAGMGHDAILLAGRGATVTMLEAEELIHLLLTDAMATIANNQNWQALHNRLTLINTNAIEYFKILQANHEEVDLVYLDPMFPHDSYQSALVNKNMQALQFLAKPPNLAEEQSLLTNALTVAKRVIVKRPHDAPFLANQATNMQWKGDVIRYDAYHKI